MEEPKTRLYLARHGEVVNHGVYNGQTDVDITPLGLKQMERLRELLKEKALKAIYCSDLIRTRKGAEIIAEPHGLAPQPFSEFREFDFGRWKGLTYPQVQEKYPSDIPTWLNNVETFRIPEGESMTDMHRRAIPFLHRLVEKHRGEDIVLVCHGALNRLILADALRLPLTHLLRIEQGYGCLNIIEYTSSFCVVKLING